MLYKYALCVLFCILISIINLQKKSEKLSQQLHQSCITQAKKNYDYFDEVSALICGKKITNPKIKDLFISNGLIHIFVVSGAHLSFYRKIIQYALPRWAASITTIIFLFTYTLTCLFSAPIFRAFVQQLNLDLNKLLKLNLSKNILLLTTAIITTLTNPIYLKSISLPMSWVAALCMTQKNSPAKTLVVFLSLFPILLTFTEPNPLSALSGFFISGLVSIFILPLNLLAFFIPNLNIILDLFYTVFYQLLELIQPSTPLSAKHSNNHSFIFLSWGYALILNLCLIIKDQSQVNTT